MQMILSRLLASRQFVAATLAMATGAILSLRTPFPTHQVFLQVIAARAPWALLSFRWIYQVSLFTTPYMLYLGMLSALYVGTLKFRHGIRPAHLPIYPDPKRRKELFVVLGEVHHARSPGPSESPHWFVIPERGLFTGIAIFGAVGSGKSSCCMFPYAQQILSFEAQDPAKRIGGIVLEVKGDFCGKIQQILDENGRAEDYVEIGLDSEFRYNPLQNNLDAYAKWAVGHNSLLIITWDEDSSNYTYPSKCPQQMITTNPWNASPLKRQNRIPTIIIGAHVKPGPSGAMIVTHWNVLRTILEMEGLAPIGASTNVQPITGIWQ